MNFNNLMADPMFNMGLGIMAANRPGVGFGGAVGQGGLLGMQNVQAYQQQQMAQQLRQQQEARLQADAQQEALKRQAFEQWVSSLPPDQQVVARGNPQLFLAQQQGEPMVQALVNGQPQYVPRSQAAGLEPYRGAGLSLQVGPDGSVSFAQGAPLTTATRNKVQERQFNTGEALARLNSISEAFKPEYLEFGTRLGAGWSALKEKAGVGLNEQDKTVVAEFSKFKRRSIDHLNSYLHEMSGAAITPQEAERLTKGMPNAGVGVFDGDSPTEFKSKLDDVTGQLRAAAKRYVLAQQFGLDWRAVSLDRVPRLVQKRGEQLTKKFQAQGMTQQQAEKAALDALAAELNGGL